MLVDCLVDPLHLCHREGAGREAMVFVDYPVTLYIAPSRARAVRECIANVDCPVHALHCATQGGAGWWWSGQMDEDINADDEEYMEDDDGGYDEGPIY